MPVDSIGRRRAPSRRQARSQGRRTGTTSMLQLIRQPGLREDIRSSPADVRIAGIISRGDGRNAARVQRRRGPREHPARRGAPDPERRTGQARRPLAKPAAGYSAHRCIFSHTYWKNQTPTPWALCAWRHQSCRRRRSAPIRRLSAASAALVPARTTTFTGHSQLHLVLRPAENFWTVAGDGARLSQPEQQVRRASLARVV